MKNTILLNSIGEDLQKCVRPALEQVSMSWFRWLDELWKVAIFLYDRHVLWWKGKISQNLDGVTLNLLDVPVASHDMYNYGQLLVGYDQDLISVCVYRYIAQRGQAILDHRGVVEVEPKTWHGSCW